jgi:hypothetical protein
VRFYLGTHKPAHLARTGVPLFVSRRTLAGRRTLPRALGRWALDSGGFSELSLHGRWETTPAQYVAEAQRFTEEIGGLDWAAIQDWMCEPFMLVKTGLTLAEHQRRTCDSFDTLRALAPDLPWTPVLQGWTLDDYLRHLDDYATRGHDLRRVPVVGLGSICRRQATSEATGIIARLASEGLRLHGFGLKLAGLRRCRSLLASADSMAWSFDARAEARKGKLPQDHHHGKTGRGSCANCLQYMLDWGAKIDGGQQQLDLVAA